MSPALTQTLYHNIDLLWVPVALVTMEKGKRLATVGFVLSCSLLLRLEQEMLERTGHANGFFGIIETGSYGRGLIVYSVFIMLFLALAYFSPGSSRIVHFAASITILIAAFCVSAIIMAL